MLCPTKQPPLAYDYISCSSFSLPFIIPLAPPPPRRYWNYLRRQLFVLDTYYSSSNRTTNHTMMLLHSYCSAVFTAAVAATLLQVLLLLAAMAAGGLCCSVLQAGGVLRLDAAGGVLSGWGFREAAGVLRGLSKALTGDAGSSFTQLCSSSSSSMSWWVGMVLSSCSLGLVVFSAAVTLSQLSVWFMTRQCLLLLRELSPGADQQLLHPRMRYGMLWAGWVFENALLPVCMAYTYCCDHIVWGGIRYKKSGGKVVEVRHPVGAK